MNLNQSYDLTDTHNPAYASSISHRSSSSDEQNRHPRGESPRQLHYSAKSQRSHASSSRGSISGSGGEGRKRELPSLERLVRFLDLEEGLSSGEGGVGLGDVSRSSVGSLGGQSTKIAQNNIDGNQSSSSSNSRRIYSPRRSIGPSTSTPPPTAPVPSSSSTAKQDTKLFSQGSLPIPGNTQGPVASTSRSSTPSPSIRAAQTSRTGSGARGDVSRVGENSRVDVEVSRVGAGYAGAQGSGRIAGEVAGTQSGTNDYERKQSLDSVAQLADDALLEFETIISQTHSSPRKPSSPYVPHSPRSPLPHTETDEIRSVKPGHYPNSPSRPISRLRNIPEPDLGAGEGGRAATGVEEVRSEGVRFESREAEMGREREIAAEPRLPSIFDQLRQANAYIDKLENQVREITTVVTQLKAERPLPPPQPSNSDTAALQNAWNLARHVLAVIPTAPSLESQPPSLASLSLALDFTREMDRLAGTRKGGARRDEDIFTEENLDKVVGRVKSWERVVRGGQK